MSKIEWTDITWNPVTGCDWISPGCDNCYARKMAKRLKHIPHSKEKYRNGFAVTCHFEELKRDFGKKPKKIFVCSMSDIFHREVPFSFIRMVLNKIRENPQHTFQLLTKRPHMAFDFQRYCEIDWPDNIWLGVTAENQPQLEKRGSLLGAIDVKNTFLSIEPMISKIQIPKEYFEHLFFEWVIVGGETGQNNREMNPEWARSVRDQCKKHGVPFFFKQMSNKQPIPNDLLIKEFPKNV